MFGSKINNKVEVVVDGGYSPSKFKLKAGEPAEVSFTRVSDKGCAQQIIFNGELRNLPLNESVTFNFTPVEKARHHWSCGMKMILGSYSVK